MEQSARRSITAIFLLVVTVALLLLVFAYPVPGMLFVLLVGAVAIGIWNSRRSKSDLACARERLGAKIIECDDLRSLLLVVLEAENFGELSQRLAAMLAKREGTINRRRDRMEQLDGLSNAAYQALEADKRRLKGHRWPEGTLAESHALQQEALEALERVHQETVGVYSREYEELKGANAKDARFIGAVERLAVACGFLPQAPANAGAETGCHRQQ